MRQTVQEAIDFALTHGLIKLNQRFELNHAPFTMSPCEISQEVLEQIIFLTPLFNTLMFKVSKDKKFLNESLAAIARTDIFVKELLSILIDSRKTQSIQLLINRNDFMLGKRSDASELPIPKQVEFNAIAASYPYLSSQMCRLHHFLNGILGGEKNLVDNDPISGIVAIIAEAFRLYDVPRCCLLTIVQPRERNVFDQRGGEYQLWDEFGILTIRMSLEEVAQEGSLKQGHLMVYGKIAAVTYFRAGYTPNDYPTPEAWKARRLIEASSTIAVPSIAMQLTGLKKIQQVLSTPKVLRNFVDEDCAGQIESTFVGLYLLDELIRINGEYQTARQAACHFPNNFVLKPQREGGGNNFYGRDMIGKLQSLDEESSRAYILMERIYPVPHQAYMLTEGQLQETEAVSEIGRFGVCLAEDRDILQNRDVGYLVRTKAAHQNEGGVSAGYACLDTLCLN